MDVIEIIIIGALAGFLGGDILTGKGSGFFVNLIFGVVGGFLGCWFFGLIGIEIDTLPEKLIAYPLGATALIWLTSCSKKRV